MGVFAGSVFQGAQYRPGATIHIDNPNTSQRRHVRTLFNNGSTDLLRNRSRSVSVARNDRQTDRHTDSTDIQTDRHTDIIDSTDMSTAKQAALRTLVVANACALMLEPDRNY